MDNLLCSRDVVDMVAKCNEKIKEKLSATIIHLELHGAAALEGASRANDESEIVCSKFGIGVRRVVVSVSC